MTENLLKTHKREAVRVTLIGAFIDFALGVIKILAGLIAGSFALVSDGIHSLSDLVTDAFVLIMARVSHEEPDREHPYGHRRFETLGTIMIGTGLFIVAGVICYDSIRRFGALEDLRIPGFTALAAALVSIAAKEWIFRYTRKVAGRINSSMLLANAWHSRTDALSSIAVLTGIVGAQLGFLWMDLVAAIVVAGMIGKIAWGLLHTSLSELVDTAVPKEEVADIRRHILALPGIVGVHSLRSRRHGGQTFLDIHVQVDSRISVSEGHHLGDRIILSLKAHYPAIADVVIHIDPELDPEDPKPTLPLRKEVIDTLVQRWQDLLSREDIEKIDLHYLEEQIEAEVMLKKYHKNKELINDLEKEVEDIGWLRAITFYARL